MADRRKTVAQDIAWLANNVATLLDAATRDGSLLYADRLPADLSNALAQWRIASTGNSSESPDGSRDMSSPEELAKLPHDHLAGIASALISDMACIEIACSRPAEDVATSAALHSDSDCYETVCLVRAMRRERDVLRAALIGLVGSADEAELTVMEAAMRAAPVPEADKATGINAIHALIATMPKPQAKPSPIEEDPTQ